MLIIVHIGPAVASFLTWSYCK